MRPSFYVAIALMLISAMLGVMMVVAWRRFDRPAHALTWGAAFGLGAAMFAARIVYDLANPYAMLLMSGLGMGTAILLAVGHRQRVGLPHGLPLLMAGWVGAILLLAGCTLIWPHIGLQRAIAPGYAAIMILLAMRALKPAGRGPTAIEIAGMVVLGIFLAIEMVSFALGLAQGAAGDPHWSAIYRAARILVLPAAYSCVGIFLVFLLADDLATRMRRLAATDALTGIANRRGFEERAAGEMARSVRRHQPLAIVIADIDRFKAINDRFGHDGGDRALQAFADHIRIALRGQDVFGRLGGEEFAILLPDTGSAEAMLRIDALRASFESCRCPAISGKQLTASFGVAMREDGDGSVGDILRRADHALYLSKRGGRNRSTLYGAEPSRRTAKAA